LIYALGASALLGLGSALGKTDPADHSPSLARESTLNLVRSYLVWTLISVPALVDASPKILETLLHSPVPLVKPITESTVRKTFFRQFIPGETAEECLPAMEDLRRRNVGHALNYSAEGDTEDDGKVKVDPVIARLREIEKALDVQGVFEERMAQEGWQKGSSTFALKMVSTTKKHAI
jgi:proline dehydrogenase